MIDKRWALVSFILLTGCATVPPGPRVPVMPGAGMSFEQFQVDDRFCRAYADRSLGVGVNDTGTNNLVTGALVGTVIGAAVGALVGGHHSAATGAGVGLVAGSAMGAGNAQVVQDDAQQRYDIAYAQCMYAKGHQVPRAFSVADHPRHDTEVIYERVPTTVIIQAAPEDRLPMSRDYP